MGLKSLLSKVFDSEDNLQPQNVPERLVWWSIILTYPIWIIGGLYVVGSVLCWLLLVCLLIKILARMDHPEENEEISISPVIWLWIIGMIIMQVALISWHWNYHQVLNRVGQGMGGSRTLSTGRSPADP